MKAHCNQKTFEFQAENSRKIVAHFNGGNISSDAGGVLLKQTEQATGIITQFADCFTDHRDPDLLEHTVEELISQRTFALALGYEDLNDHDELRNDPLLAVLVGKKDPVGKERIRKRDKGKPLAGKSTLKIRGCEKCGLNTKQYFMAINLMLQTISCRWRSTLFQFWQCIFCQDKALSASAGIVGTEIVMPGLIGHPERKKGFCN